MSRPPSVPVDTAAPRGNGRYRKLYPRIWVNRDFLALPEGDRLVALYLLTGPQVNRVGLFRFSPGAAAEDFGLSVPAFRRRFDRVISAFGWQFDDQARVLWIPSWWKFNAPEGPNQLKGALTDLGEVPQSPLRAQFSRHTETLPSDTLRETFLQTLTETISERLPKPSPIQEQEHEQEQEREGSRGERLPEPSDRGRTSGGVLRGALPRDHRHHAACDDTYSRCVPTAVHDKLANLLAPRHQGERAAASAALKAWYPEVWATLPADFVMGDGFKFWQSRFDARFATKDAASAPAAPRPRDCDHEPRCETERVHSDRLLAESRPRDARAAV